MLRLFLLILLTAAQAISSPAANAQEAKAQTPAPAVRGVWLTNVASDALYSRENIREAVGLCSELGFNVIFVVTWNDTYTTYPSAHVEAVTGQAIHPDFAGRDPLQELIEEAHAKGIKVFAWFEFGFSATMNDSTGGIILQKNPHWASRDQQGRITEKNGFQWMNPFHPKVQDFVKGLVLEAVRNYDIDGIQGDDRLPALPSNGGYDEFTTQLYQSEHSGQKPPAHYQDYEWVKWRSAKLSLFLAGLVQEVRAAKPELAISMAPSIYPWSEENYLQNWPEWMAMGLVDLIIPQVYRYNLEAYQREMNRILTRQLHPSDRERFVPGVLLQVNDYNPTEELLEGFINYNREHGIPGEVFFFFEGIKKFKGYFKEKYKDRPAFPAFIRPGLPAH